MKKIGIVRKLDNLGRIVIPKEYRNLLTMKDHDPVEIILTNSGVLVKKSAVLCCICSNDKKVIEFMDNLICISCIRKIKRLSESL